MVGKYSRQAGRPKVTPHPRRVIIRPLKQPRKVKQKKQTLELLENESDQATVRRELAMGGVPWATREKPCRLHYLWLITRTKHTGSSSSKINRSGEPGLEMEEKEEVEGY
jgi:hypothetical protein